MCLWLMAETVNAGEAIRILEPRSSVDRGWVLICVKIMIFLIELFKNSVDKKYILHYLN